MEQLFGFIIFLAVCAGLFILIKKYERKKKYQALEQTILLADRANEQQMLWDFMNAYDISEKEYNAVRKKMYLRLAEAGDAFAMSMAALGALAEGAEEDHLMWLRKAAQAGDFDSMYMYALQLSIAADACEDPEQQAESYKEAFQLFQKVASRGHDGAMSSVASAYYFGNGVEQNKKRAYQYARECADRGYTSCAFFIVDYFRAEEVDGERYVSDSQQINLMEMVIHRKEEETFAKAAYYLGRIFGWEYMNGRPADSCSDRYKAAYCFALAHFCDDSYDAGNIYKVYNPSTSELKKWKEDADNLDYNPPKTGGHVNG